VRSADIDCLERHDDQTLTVRPAPNERAPPLPVEIRLRLACLLGRDGPGNDRNGDQINGSRKQGASTAHTQRPGGTGSGDP
jgi:hypothetical protein